MAGLALEQASHYGWTSVTLYFEQASHHRWTSVTLVWLLLLAYVSQTGTIWTNCNY